MTFQLKPRRDVNSTWVKLNRSDKLDGLKGKYDGKFTTETHVRAIGGKDTYLYPRATSRRIKFRR